MHFVVLIVVLSAPLVTAAGVAVGWYRDARRQRKLAMRVADLLGGAMRIADAWKAFALAYETLIECAVQKDRAGAENAAAEVARCRQVLRALREYDA